MKRKKQIEESKRMIADAFMRLLQNDSLEDITISQIAAEARMGRNTFYNHFQKKEDILRYVMKQLLTNARNSRSSTGGICRKSAGGIYLALLSSLLALFSRFLFSDGGQIRREAQ